MKIVILGATSPIARILAARFAAGGARLYLGARDTEEASRIANDLAIRTSATVFAGSFEATDFAAHQGMLDRAVAELGGLDGMVVCFGTLTNEEVAQTDSHETLASLHQNFTGAATMMTLAARRLEQQGAGFIIVIGSVAGDRGRARNYVYGAAKAALAMFAQGMRARLARSGVHVLTVKLGPVDTRMTWGRERTPFAISPEAAVDAIYAAWRRKAEVVYVPRVWRPIMGIMKLVPERLFKRVSF